MKVFPVSVEDAIELRRRKIAQMETSAAFKQKLMDVLSKTPLEIESDDDTQDKYAGELSDDFNYVVYED